MAGRNHDENDSCRQAKAPADSFSKRPERATQNTGSPSYEHPHGISFLGWQKSSHFAGRWSLTPWWRRPVQRAVRAASRTSAGWPMLPAGDPGNDRRVEILISLDTIDPPVGQLRVASPPGTAPERGEGKEFRFTGWLGLLRALYDAMGSPTGEPPGDPRRTGRLSRPSARTITGHTGPAGLNGLVNNTGFGLACPTELLQLPAFSLSQPWSGHIWPARSRPARSSCPTWPQRSQSAAALARQTSAAWLMSVRYRLCRLLAMASTLQCFPRFIRRHGMNTPAWPANPGRAMPAVQRCRALRHSCPGPRDRPGGRCPPGRCSRTLTPELPVVAGHPASGAHRGRSGRRQGHCGRPTTHRGDHASVHPSAAGC